MSDITVRGARLHNLKNISLSLPKNKFILFTGLSGSGKSTMAFDTLHREGQRQYMESLGLVTHGTKPALDSISGLSPSISIEQGLSNHSPRSTVGTATEVFTYLRVLFARTGHRPCPRCGADIPPVQDAEYDGLWEEEDGGGQSPGAGGGQSAGAGGGQSADADDPDTPRVPCPSCGFAVPEMGMAMFSFNKPDGACPTCTGLGTIYTARLETLIDESKSIAEGGVLGWDGFWISHNSGTLRSAGRYYGFDFDTSLPIGMLGQIQRDLLLYGVGSAAFKRHFPGVEQPNTVAKGNFEGVATNLLRRHAEHITDTGYLEKIERQITRRACPDCQGTRLRPESRAVTVVGKSIIEVSQMPLSGLAKWLEALREALPAGDWLVAEPVVFDLAARVRRLDEVGLGYLTLDRSTPTLSAGEGQRLRLASLLGSGLTGVLYVLDEPTIGLHGRDNARLIKMLRALRDLENTVLVIEHDMEMVAAADWIVDFGPGAGRAGGQVVAQGTPEDVAATPASLTGQYLCGAAKIQAPVRRRATAGRPRLVIRGAREHNLKNITARFPLNALVAVTGVSGSGKSSLMFDILDRAARQRFYGAADQPGPHDAIEGWEHVDKVITIDQEPIGRSTRSNAATYTDAFTAIREAFAAQPEAKARGFGPQHFSFNVPGGRCERCEGAGVLQVEMQLLPAVEVRCPACHGHRYKREVLAVKYKGYDIAQVLNLTIAEALPLFGDIPTARARLGLMAETGLGYLQLGQPASTFSGGEAQRVKLAKELGRRGTGRTLYLLDEPTTGLHPGDIAHLLLLLQRLVDAGNSVMVLEHNLDVIKCADWVIDLGPEGGDAGGEIIAEGTPEEVAEVERSQTGVLLKRVLKREK